MDDILQWLTNGKDYKTGVAEDVVAQRRRILEDRLPLIRRYEKLYPLKEKYFDTGEVPAELVRMIREKSSEEPEPIANDSRTEFEVPLCR